MEEQKTEYSAIDKAYERKARVTRTIPILQKAGLAVWSLVDIVLICGIFIFFVLYLIQGVFTEKALVARVAQNQEAIRSASVSNRAQGLVISDARVFPGVSGRYDIYAEVTNPNEDWLATFDYYFRSSQGDTRIRRGFALPRRTFYAVELSQGDGERRPSTGELIIENIRWERISGLPNADTESWLAIRERFGITDVNHGIVAGQEGGDRTQTTFTIQNNTPYAYWDVDLIVRLRLGQSVVGVNKIRMPYIDGNERVEQTINWLSGGVASGVPEIIPQINYFDEEVYKEEEGRATGEIREQL